MMRHRSWLLLLPILMVVGVQAAGPETKYRAPRIASNQPDLGGVWNFSSDVPLERPAAAAERKFLTAEERDKYRTGIENTLKMIGRFAPVEDVQVSWLDHTSHVDDLRTSIISHPENGQLPALVEGVRRLPSVEQIIGLLASGGQISPEFLAAFAGNPKLGPENFSNSERCLFAASTPLIPGLNDNYLQIVQGRDHVVLLTDGTHRIVALDGRPHLSEQLRSWSGDSRGRWEGDTLVVETKNFNRRTRSFSGAGTAEGKVVTERFTRVAQDRLEYEATIVDPKTFQDKVVLSFPMAKVDAHLYEVACHEGNYSLPNALAGSRKEEREAAASK
jgi:hypothetical protein